MPSSATVSGVVVSLAAAVGAVAGAAGSARPEVAVTDGTLRGVVDKGVHIFRGVPFAAPPVRELRWRPPQPALPWVGARDAAKFGSQCLDSHGVGDEDCLFLNIFAPPRSANLSTDALPCLLWVHGGGYEYGSSNLYDATNLVNFFMQSGQPAVVVTTNYRLSVLGFLGSEALRSRDEEGGSTGNYGLQDQRAAFRWVQDNVGAFGGDPSRVMIFGESAGAGSISAHLAMPKSAGLFSSAAIESGSFPVWSARPIEHAEEVYDQLLVATGCRTSACLEALPAAELISAAWSLPVGHCCLGFRGKAWIPWSPTVDGVELTQHPYELLRQGRIAKVPVLHGTNLDEGTMFTDEARNITAVQFDKSLQAAFGSMLGPNLVSSAADLYMTERHTEVVAASDGWWAAQRSNGDQFFHCAADTTSERLAASGQDVFQYYFTRPTKGLVIHSQEIHYVFLSLASTQRTDEDVALAQEIASYWYRHAASGSPNGRGEAADLGPAVRWPRYRFGEAVYLQIDVPSAGGVRQVKEALRRKTCNFMDQWLDRVIPAGPMVVLT